MKGESALKTCVRLPPFFISSFLRQTKDREHVPSFLFPNTLGAVCPSPLPSSTALVSAFAWRTVYSKCTGRFLSCIYWEALSDKCHICSCMPRGKNLTIHNENSISPGTWNLRSTWNSHPSLHTCKLILMNGSFTQGCTRKKEGQKLAFNLTAPFLVYKLNLDSFWVNLEFNIKENIICRSGCRNSKNINDT